MLHRATASILVLSLALSSVACSSSSSGGGGGTSPGGGSKPTSCRKNTTTQQCECSSGELTLSGDYEKVADCDNAPSGALICAHYATTDEVDSCYYRVPTCAKVNRNFATCECGLRGDTPTQASCTGRVCCSFDGACQCTDYGDSSIAQTQFDKSCTYQGTGNGKIVSSCTADLVKPECEGSLKKVSSCAGLKWQAPGTGGGGSSSSGCSGCHADSDCGHCGRCTLSTCTCSQKAACN